MAKRHVTFLQTEGLQLRLFPFVHSSGGEHRLQHDRLFFRGRFPRYARAPVRLPEWSQADAPTTVTHRILLLRCGLGQNRGPKSDSLRIESLQLWRKLADQIFDLLCFMPVTDQKRVLCLHNDEVMDSEERNGCPALLENYVVAGIERGDGAIRGVSLPIFLKIIGHCSPASDVVPIETGLHDKDAVRLFHDRVVKGDPRQFAKAFAQSLLEILRRAYLGNEIRQLWSVTVEFTQHCGHRPDEHSCVPSKISLPQK